MPLPRAQIERLLARADTLTPAQARTLLASLGQDAEARCREDGWFWLRFACTRDEADAAHSVKPVPTHEAYLRWLWEEIHQHQKVVIAKSRQMFVSWAVILYCVWWARYHPNQAVYWQTKDWKDAMAMTAQAEGGFQGRAQFIEAHLPGWMQQKLKITEGMLAYPNGSMIQALAGGADKIRGKVPSVYVGDEFGHQEDQDGVWTAVAPLVQKGAKVILVSSPNGSTNTFATLWHGHPVGQVSESA